MISYFKKPARICSLGLAGVALAGCAADSGRYPSLAVRDAERVEGAFTPTAPAEQPEVHTTDGARLGEAVEAARGAHARFQAEGLEAIDLVLQAAGDETDEDARSRALVALAKLTALRGQTVIALADLDQLEVEAASLFAPLDEIHSAQDIVAGFIGEQDAALATLQAEMN